MTSPDLNEPELGAVEGHGSSRASFILRGALATGAAIGATAVAPYVSSALAAGGNMMRRTHYEPILSQAHSLVSPCFAYRFRQDEETDAQYLDRLIEELDAEFQRLGPDTVMAFLAEAVVGASN